ncbi:2-C-methyl-D-erythritol 2,4-cyclodiphosphate synthase [Taylorella equigenitalis]|nr:2-C-methyl-D-erythritol 2,4-cyclodiphosphate synthase [Taylorella equigenitalis]WDU48276.1 2-C-methyl-D-erythritol 2,4-cyclodiphosphate synthase [Taylorella equigenitalis]
MSIFAIIPAGGVGLRAIKNNLNTPVGHIIPKQYKLISGLPMIMHSVKTLSDCADIKSIHIGISDSDEFAYELELPEHCHLHTTGGLNRADTVLNTLLELEFTQDDWVLVHDAARPALKAEDLQNLINICLKTGIGGILASKVGDTIKGSEAGSNLVARTVDRSNLWQAQTPQMFKALELINALKGATDSVTDEASAIELYGGTVQLVQASRHNLKVTWPEDFEMMESMLKGSDVKEGPDRSDISDRTDKVDRTESSNGLYSIRVGQGFDVHALVEGRPLIIGGVEISHTHGLLGHSDADVLLHALTDALLGAAAIGDIGTLFPDTDPKYKDADSRKLLKEAYEKVSSSGWNVINIDSTIHAQAPKMRPHIPAMIKNIASDLFINEQQINIKAKTNEGLGYLGRKEGIAANVSVLLAKR